jgi:hypothetical protein
MCNKIYNNPHILPQYKGGMIDLLDFVQEELSPAMQDCANDDIASVASLTVQLTIDFNGKVVEVSLPKSKMDTSCQDVLKQKILDMEGWKPGQMNGQEVCCKIFYPLKINWK